MIWDNCTGHGSPPAPHGRGNHPWANQMTMAPPHTSNIPPRIQPNMMTAQRPERDQACMRHVDVTAPNLTLERERDHPSERERGFPLPMNEPTATRV